MLGIERLEYVSYGVVCGMFYCLDIEKALINADDCQECELHFELCRLVAEMHL